MKMRNICIVLSILALAACGGAPNRSGGGSTARAAFATGPISQACMAAGRDAANRSLCGCIQAAANQTLNSSEQSRAAAFFADPDQAQAARAADSRSAERFWDRYRNFSDTAKAICG